MMPSLLAIPKAKESIVASISAPKPPKLLLGLIFFFSATQLGYHLWPVSSLVYGIRIDYLSPTIYFLDLLIFVYLFSLKSYVSNLKSIFPFLPLLLTNLLFSSNSLSTLSWSLHLLLYLTFLSSLPKSSFLSLVSSILPITLLFQLALAIVQVILGHSVGIWLYWLGERTVAVGAPTIATASFMGTTVLRAYGTFSHPNTLAGYAVICLLIVFRLAKDKNSNNLLPMTTVLTVALVLLTQSRSAALALFGLILPFFLVRSLRSRLLYFVILLTIVYHLPSIISPPRSDLSFSQRFSLQQLSLQVIKHYPIFGTGGDASISTYPAVSPTFRLLQPDHNSFTLFLSWFGIVGVLAILYSLRSPLSSIVYLLFPLAPLLALDHYLLTSPQGLFVLLLYLKVVHSSHV